MLLLWLIFIATVLVAILWRISVLSSEQERQAADALIALPAALKAMAESMSAQNNILIDMKKALSRIERVISPIKPARTVEVLVEIDGQYQKVDKMEVKKGKKYLLKPVAKDEDGNVAPVDGLFLWEKVGTGVGDLKVAADGLSAEFIPDMTVGGVAVQAKADSLIGEGEDFIVGELKFEKSAGQARFVELAVEELDV